MYIHMCIQILHKTQTLIVIIMHYSLSHLKVVTRRAICLNCSLISYNFE